MNLDPVPVSHNTFSHMHPSCSRMDGTSAFVSPPPPPPQLPQRLRKPVVKIAPLPPPSTAAFHTSRCDTQPGCSLQITDECDRASNASSLKSQV